MISAIQKHYEQLYTNALNLYDRILGAGKGKRGVNWRQIYDQQRVVHETYTDSFGFMRTRDTDLDDNEYFYNFFYKNGETTRPHKPKKKDFACKIDRAKFSINLSGEASILFMDAEHCIVWSVFENNHACEHAREHPMAVALFRLLDSVKWTRGTGGTIVGNDEYNRDNSNAGGGGNYVTEKYGPKTEKPKPYGYAAFGRRF